jgi:hypothetical protein
MILSRHHVIHQQSTNRLTGNKYKTRGIFYDLKVPSKRTPSALPEPSKMAEWGSLTVCFVGFITATGGLFCLAAVKTKHIKCMTVLIWSLGPFLISQKHTYNTNKQQTYEATL